MLIPTDPLHLIFIGAAATLGVKFGLLIWDQLDHITHKILRFVRSDHEINF